MSDGGNPGRPSKLTPEVQERVCHALERGNFRSVAARYAGISPRTLREWMATGESNPDSPEGNFRRAVMGAEVAAETKLVEAIMLAAESDPRHGQWLLAHRHSSRWADKRNLKLSGEVRTGPLSSIPDSRLLELAEDEGDS